MTAIHIVLLVGILAGLAFLSWQDSRSYASFKLTDDSAVRIRFLARWTIVVFVLFGVGSVLLLLFLGRLDAVWSYPPEFASLMVPVDTARTKEVASFDGSVGKAFGFLIGMTITALVWRSRLKKARQPMLGDTQALLPRNWDEVATCVPLAINAGVSEELFFRLALPLLAFKATGSMTIAIGIALVAFGLAHWYQGWKGVLVTTAVGVLLFWLYLSSGSIVKPIAVHILFDVIALVIRPGITLYRGERAAD